MRNIMPVALVMNNPFQDVDISSIDYSIRVVPENILSHIWSVQLSDSQVKPGETVDVSVVVESYLSRRKTYTHKLRIPPNLPAGVYELAVGGASEYENFLRRAAVYKFTYENLPTLVEAINNLTNIRQDSLYFVFSLPAGGLAIEKALLPDLPPSRAIVLADKKRTLHVAPYKHWLEERLDIGLIVMDRKTVQITVKD